VLDAGRVEILDMLQTVLALTQERARSRELEIELCCPPDIGAIAADERRLKQAVFNLISNAIRFTRPGGAIRVEAECRENEMLLTVADTGTGMPQSDHRGKLENCERGAPRSGVGLGLSLVKRLIELHDGTVTIDAARGRGTTVTCRLPATRREFASLPSPGQTDRREAA
jgi:signal transduction histidine kinase